MKDQRKIDCPHCGASLEIDSGGEIISGLILEMKYY